MCFCTYSAPWYHILNQHTESVAATSICRQLGAFVFFSVYNQQTGCQYKIIKTITATWELINRYTRRWLVWWTNYRVLLLLHPANKPDYTCIMPSYPSALCWVIWFRFMTIGLRWGWLWLHLAQFWKILIHTGKLFRARGHTVYSSFRDMLQKPPLAYAFQLEKLWPPILTWNIWFSPKCWNLIPRVQIVSTHLFEAQCVSAVCWLSVYLFHLAFVQVVTDTGVTVNF